MLSATASATGAASSVAEPTGTRREQIVAEARRLLAEEGPAGLSMRRVAARLGIQAPSLYKHVADKAELELELVAAAFRDQAELFELTLGAVQQRSGPGALAALAGTYRRYACANPHLYRLVNAQPLPRERLPAGLEARAAAPLIEAAGGDPALARAAWAFAHGMVMLEIDGRFPEGADLDAAWRTGVAALGSAGSPGRATGTGSEAAAGSRS